MLLENGGSLTDGSDNGSSLPARRPAMTHFVNISKRAKTVSQSNLSANIESTSSSSAITSIILGTPSPEPYIILDAVSKESSSTMDNLVTPQTQSIIKQPPPATSFGVLNASNLAPTIRPGSSSRSILTESESSSKKSVKAKGHGEANGLPSTRKMTLQRNLFKPSQSQTNLDSGRQLHLTQSASMRSEKRRRIEGEGFSGLKMLDEEDDTAASSAIDFQMFDISGLVSLPLSTSREESSDALSIYVPSSVLSLMTNMRHILKVESAARLTAEARYVQEMDRRAAVDAQLSEERKIRAALEDKLAIFRTGTSVSSTPDTVQSSSSTTEVELLVRMSNQRDTAPPELSAPASPVHVHPEPDKPLLREESSAMESLLALSEFHTASEVTASNNGPFNKFWSDKDNLDPLLLNTPPIFQEEPRSSSTMTMQVGNTV